jgi:hypothetical protein
LRLGLSLSVGAITTQPHEESVDVPSKSLRLGNPGAQKPVYDRAADSAANFQLNG